MYPIKDHFSETFKPFSFLKFTKAEHQDGESSFHYSVLSNFHHDN
jgi:hypothetical protein